MQQSMFGESPPSTEERLVQVVEAAELRWRKTTQVALVMAGLGIALAAIAMISALAVKA